MELKHLVANAAVASCGIATALGGAHTIGRRVQDSSPAIHTLSHGGRTRSYLKHDFSGGKRAPLVLVLHGGGGQARTAVEMTGFDRVGAREGLVVVYPNGTGALESLPMFTWNAGHCCGSAMRADVDDVGFLTAIVDRLVGEGQADPARVFVTGMSNGGMMAHRLARERSDRIAALAPVVGAVFGDEPAAAGPVAAFVVVGADDDRVPGEGGPLRVAERTGRAAADRPVAPAIEQARYWARANRCGPPRESRSAVSLQITWTDCLQGKDVVMHRVTGNGHAWPGGRPGWIGAAKPTAAFDATEEIWRFFAQHPRRVPDTR
jgi:polyhydroxybutyrate depolymerase